MGATTRESSQVVRLLQTLQRCERARPTHVWRLLSADEREEALQRCAVELAGETPEQGLKWRARLVRVVINNSRGFRPSTIRSWSLDRLAQHVARVHDPGVLDLITDVVLAHHSVDVLARVQAPLMDQLGIQHRRGVVEDDDLLALEALEDDQLCARAIDAWRKVPTPEMALYMLALALVFPSRWSPLLAILPTIGEELFLENEHVSDGVHAQPSLAEKVLQEAVCGEASNLAKLDPIELEKLELEEENEKDVGTARQPKRGATPETAQLSALDEEVIYRIAASLQEITGAPGEDRIDAIVDELIGLNATRHQTFYLRGFHDAVRRRPERTVLPAQNPSRWRWYMAGFVAGLARLDDVDGINALWERRPEVRALGDTGRGPSRYAMLHVVRALRARERYSDAVAFTAPDAVARNEDLAHIMLDIGTTLQRQQRIAEASPVFERLLQTEAVENVLSPNFWATVKRRHAHCLRSEGKLEAARRLLEEALEDAEAVERAMVVVDLGLIQAGYGRLTDIRLPSSFDAAAEIAGRLDRGDQYFREAEILGVSTSSHAHYVLGMRELLRRRYTEAEQLLSRAVSQFDLERERYDPAQLLVRAHLHLAIARCANIESDASRLEAAIRDISSCLADPADLPDIYIGEVIAGLMLRDDVKADELVERLLTDDRDALLDALVQDEKAHQSTAVADALAVRFRRDRRSERQRMNDGVALVGILLRQGRYEEASGVLEEAEELAVRSSAGAHFLSFLENAGETLTSVWETVDITAARVRVLESLGRLDEAARVLRGAFARALARDDAQGRLDACDVIDTLEEYRCTTADELEGMRSRVARATSALGKPSNPSRAIHVLVVGGNEVQAQYDDAIRAHFRESAPWVTVDFMHTGWSSNWGEKVDDFSRRVVRADAVVLIYLMRTEFGRAVRKKMNGRPWRGCGGKGRDSVQRAIAAAVSAVPSS